MGRRRTRRRRRYVPLLLAGLFLLTALISLAFSRPFAPKSGVPSPSGVGTENLPSLPGERVTFLVMGVDKRPGDVGRSDSMIVVTYDLATRRIAMLSLPRDTWVPIPGYGYDKLNHSYAYGGEELAVSTVQQLLGIPIDHYVTVSFYAFEDVVNALGGVTVDAEKRMYYVDPYDTSMGPEGLVIDIQPGVQEMDGETALKYARFRMDGEGDLGRIRRQQQLIRAMITKASTPSVITRIPQLIPALADTIDTDMTVMEMLQLATGAKEALSNPLETGTLEGTPQYIGEVYYQVLDLADARIKAYKLLVGEDPPNEFVLRARQDEAIYDQALASAIAAAPKPAPEDEEKPAGGKGEEGEGQGDKTEPGAETGPGKTQPGEEGGAGEGGESGAEDPSGGEDDFDEPGTETMGPGPGPSINHPAPLTVALVDASGYDLADAYAALLMGAGYQVTSVQIAGQVLDRTVALDHGGGAAGLQALVPNLTVVDAPNPDAVGIELFLGRDLVE